MSEYLGELENYPDLHGSIIRATKIHKVLKAMLKLPSIPLDEEFNFRERCQTLLGKWNAILASEPNGDNEDRAEAGITNGESAQKEDDDEAEPKKKIGTTTEGEKEEADGLVKAGESEKTAEEKKTDGPALDSAPAKEYKPSADDMAVDDEASD